MSLCLVTGCQSCHTRRHWLYHYWSQAGSQLVRSWKETFYKLLNIRQSPSLASFKYQVHCDWEVRPWSVTATARRSALAGCSSAGAVQAGGDGPPLSGTASPVVPCRLLRAGLHDSWSPASAIRQSPSTHRSSRPSQHFRRSCFRHCGPNSLEFSAWQFACSSCWAWSVSTWLENASVWVTLRLV